MFAGRNIVILDLECARSADDCRFCGQSNEECVRGFPVAENTHVFTKIGWDDPRALGLSIGCYYDYRNSRMHWFDVPTLEETVRDFVKTQPLLVSFNGIRFDFVLIRRLLRHRADDMLDEDIPDWTDERPGSALARTKRYAATLMDLCDTFKTHCATSYDILDQIWHVDPERKFERSLNSLDVISQANGFGTKAMDGATAPRLWAQGRYAEVIAYNVSDVLKTRALFEKIITNNGVILRGDGLPITLSVPPGLALETNPFLALDTPVPGHEG